MATNVVENKTEGEREYGGNITMSVGKENLTILPISKNSIIVSRNISGTADSLFP